MTILRSGSNKKYADGWEVAFGKKRPARKQATAKKTTAAKKSKKKK